MGSSRHRIKLSYARDEDDEIIPVHQAQKQTDYACPECGGTVFVRGGEKTQYIRHFVHANSPGEGCGSAALHRVTKNRIIDTVRANNPLFIQRPCASCSTIMRSSFFLDTTNKDVEIEEGTKTDRDLPDLVIKTPDKVAFVDVSHDERLSVAKRRRYRKRGVKWVECSTVLARDRATKGLVLQGLTGSFSNHYCASCDNRRLERIQDKKQTKKRFEEAVSDWLDNKQNRLHVPTSCPECKDGDGVGNITVELDGATTKRWVASKGWYAPVLVHRNGERYDAFAFVDAKSKANKPDYDSVLRQLENFEEKAGRIGIVEIPDDRRYHPRLLQYRHHAPSLARLDHCARHRAQRIKKLTLNEELRGVVLNNPVMIRYCSRCGERSRHHRFFEPPSSIAKPAYDRLRFEFDHLSCGPGEISSLTHRIERRVDIVEQTPSQVLEENEGGILFLASRQEEKAIFCRTDMEHDPGALGLYQCRKCYDDMKNRFIIKSRSPTLGKSSVRLSGLEDRHLNNFDFVTRSFYDRSPDKADIVLVDGHGEEALSFNVFLGESGALNELPKPVTYLDDLGGDRFVIHHPRGEIILSFD